VTEIAGLLKSGSTFFIFTWEVHVSNDLFRRKAFMKLDNAEETYSQKFGGFVEKLGFHDVPKPWRLMEWISLI
jgi:hypothetical protein